MNVILDYGLGNIRSVRTWLSKGGLETVVSRDADLIRYADLLVLPGVGAYRDAMKALKKYNLDDMIYEHVKMKKPLIGICLGMQLLYEYSHEDGCYEGLGLIKGKVVPFEESKGIKIPHMGWNDLKIKEGNKYFNDLNGEYVYYVHSYYVESGGDEVVGITNYDSKISGIVIQDNVMGFQFHPEKSGEVGERILDNIKEFLDDYIPGN